MHQLSLFIITIVVISGALCSDYVIMSKCAHNKAIHIDHDGKVSVTDIPQNITIAGTPDFLATNVFKVTLYVKETQMYLCFNNHWRLVGMKKLQDSCYFKESIVRGYFEFHSIQNLVRRVGFTHRGKPVGPKKSVNDDCYRFTKVAASEFTRTQTTTTTTITPTTTTITATTAATGSNNDGHSNNNSISGTSNSRPRTNSSSSSNSNLNNNVKKSSTVNPHRTRHRHNSTRIGPKRQHHLQEQTETDTRLRHQSATAAAGNGSATEFTGTTTRRRRKKKKKTVFHYDGQQNRNNQYLNPRDPEHRRLVYEQHEHQQQHQQHQQQQQHHHSHEPQNSSSTHTQLYDSGGDGGDIYPSIQDEYSNDDASAILPDLPNNLDSSTEYLYSSSVSSTRHRPNYNKKFLSHGSTNRRRLNSSHVSSSSSSSNWDRSVADPNTNTRSSSSFHNTGAVALDSKTSTRKYYRKSNPGLIAASLQSTVVGNSSPKDPSLIGDSKIAAINLGKMKTNHKDKSLVRLRKKIQVGS